MGYQSKILQTKIIAEKTLEIQFEKPAGFKYLAGQFIELLINLNGEKAGHCFTLCSAPFEDTLAIATRLTGSDYKKTLEKLRLGDQVEFDGPMGQFILHKDNSKSAVFLAGGIGITPCFSIIKDESKLIKPHKVFLFYSNKTKASAAFLDHLIKIHWPGFKMIPTMTAEAAWLGEKGYIDEAMLKKYVPEIKEPLYYVVGLPALVKALVNLLKKLNIPEEQIKFEEFAGY